MHRVRAAALVAAAPLLAAAGPVGPDAPPTDDRLAIETRLSLAGCDQGLSLALPAVGGTTSARGTVTGVSEGQQLFGSYCTGYFVDAAFACFRVPDGGARVDLEIVDGGGTDTTLAIWDADELLRCDDDGGTGLLSRLDVTLDGGVYYVYVGTFSRQATSDFEIELRRP